MDVVVPDEFKHLYETSDERPVVKIPEPVLRSVAKEVPKVNKRVRVIADNMVSIMKKARGVGIAAPQIGVSERIIVIAPERKPIVLINPVVVSSSGTQVREEGCLSIPGLYGDVERAAEVEIEAYDVKGRAVGFTMEGYAATVVQHEIDHLDGILFIDKVDPKTLHWQDPERDDED